MPDDIKKPTKTAPKIMDVINKHSQAPANSRPIIPSKNPQPDPMVVVKKGEDNTKHKMASQPSFERSKPEDDTASPSDNEQQQSTESKLSVHHALRLEPVDPHKVGEVFTPSDDNKPVENPEIEDDKTPETLDQSSDDTPRVNTELKATGSESENDDVATGKDSLAEDSKPSNEPTAADSTSSDEQSSDKSDKDSSANAKSDTKDSIDEEEALEPVDLLRDQEKHYHGSAVAILLGILVIIILAAVAIDLAVDASLISLNVPHTHFFS